MDPMFSYYIQSWIQANSEKTTKLIISEHSTKTPQADHNPRICFDDQFGFRNHLYKYITPQTLEHGAQRHNANNYSQ